MNRGDKWPNKWFITGCLVFLACLTMLVDWLAPSDVSTEDLVNVPTASATAEPSDDSRALTLTAKQKADITKVLRVYYASPPERKETPKSVKSLVTAEFADRLKHQWDGLMPNTKSTVKKLKVVGAAVIDGERRVNVSVVVTTYIDKKKSTETWSARLTLTDDDKVSGLEDYPDEGVG